MSDVGLSELNDIQSELPEGWAEIRLGDVLRSGGLFDGPFGSNLKTSDYTDAGVRVIRLENLGNLRFNNEKRTFISEAKYESLVKHTVVQGDIIFGSFVDQAVRVCQLPNLDVPAIAKADCFCLRPNDSVTDPRFLTYFLGKDDTRDVLIEHIHGATRPRINTSQLRELRVAIAPLAEQRRIVAKLEELLGKVSSSQQRLSRVPRLLKRFRQSVLAAACSGKLTADWRAENDDLEPVSALLDRVGAERFDLWCQVTEAKARADERTIRGESWKSRYVQAITIDGESLGELPETWKWMAFDTFAASFQYGPRFAEGEYTNEGVPTVRTSDMNFRGEISLNNPPRVVVPENSRDHFILQSDDLVVTRTGATIGKCALYDMSLGPVIASAYLIRYRLTRTTTVPRFLLTVLMSPWGQQQLLGGATAVAQPNINTTTIAQIPIPLPPLAEQQEIVRRVQHLFAFADKIEARLKQAQAHVDRLTQSLLRKAFRGELVPTEAELARREGREYEPASALLERIRPTATSAKPETKRTVAKTRSIPKDVFLRRASVVSYSVHRLASHPSFGRTQLEKTVHLAQCHLGIDMGFVFERYHAGPFDSTIYALEATADKKGWFTTKDRPKFGVTYHPGPQIEEICKQAIEFLGAKRDELDRLLDHIAHMDMEQAELLATAYAAWNDLLLDGRPVNDDAIAAEIYAWHSSKDKFTRDRIKICLKWMREHKYVPRGQGERTKVAAKTTKKDPARPDAAKVKRKRDSDT